MSWSAWAKIDFEEDTWGERFMPNIVRGASYSLRHVVALVALHTCQVQVSFASVRGAAVAERLACSLPTKANWVQSPAGGVSQVGIVPDYAVGRWVFWGFFRFPRPKSATPSMLIKSVTELRPTRSTSRRLSKVVYSHLPVDVSFPARAAVAELLAYSPPTKAIQDQSPAGSLPIFARGNRARRPTGRRVSSGYCVSPALSFRCCSVFISARSSVARTLEAMSLMVVCNSSSAFLMPSLSPWSGLTAPRGIRGADPVQLTQPPVPPASRCRVQPDVYEEADCAPAVALLVAGCTYAACHQQRSSAITAPAKEVSGDEEQVVANPATSEGSQQLCGFGVEQPGTWKGVTIKPARSDDHIPLRE
ncbi:hypothetical protein PR048_030039 [Dryococelus australis]|uniref:Uncharacterized protein n=1 Tax=Dryococelus australis TaxID=614101 RepID=A0ABQ9GAH5_9NEOP|nr:hypothetical protein PR048_030039 [Dryococelus australis]